MIASWSCENHLPTLQASTSVLEFSDCSSFKYKKRTKYRHNAPSCCRYSSYSLFSMAIPRKTNKSLELYVDATLLRSCS